MIGHNIAGSYATFPGVVGTAVSKVYNLEIARTGLRERDAAHAGFGYVTVTVRSGTRAAYFPGAQRLTVKMTALDLAYAPPFSPVWDPILVAAARPRQPSAPPPEPTEAHNMRWLTGEPPQCPPYRAAGGDARSSRR